MVTVTDSASPLPATQTSPTYKILIDTLPPVINTTPAPSAGAVNLPYSFTFTASLGLAPFSWSETGALPPGLNFSTDGVLFGTPTATGSFPVSLDVTDSIGRAAPQQDFTLQIFQHGFKATGSMGTARYWHAATLLNSGKVLVTGGRDGSGNQLTTAELYDSTSGSFAPTGNMGTARLVNTVTLLNNGKVLVTGGLDVNGHALATAELFDPATGSFTPTGSLQTARGWHTATLLTNGKVLVTGGSDASDNPLATAELFDSTSGTFTVTGSMIIAHRSQSATLLNNGKVLVAGGTDNLGNALAEAELFDPASGTFSPTGNMQSARSLHEATLLSDGKVLVTGGLVDVGGQVLATAEAELFDPASGSFAPVGSMTNVRYLHTATLLNDGTVLVAGGVGDTTGSNPFAAAEVFDPTSGTFTPTGSMGTPRSQHTATLLNDGTVLVTGGGPPTLATAELYE
jgi:WD40 repeat protein